MTKENNQPIYIMSEGTQRNSGKNAQRLNILAAKLIAESIRTTLGPKGMDKMLVNSLGEVTVTNDGVTILREMDVDHPAAKMVIEVAKTQEDEVGDGTTTAVVLAGELLKRAEDLLDQNIHPSIITKGYRFAAEKSIEYLNKIAEKLDDKDLHRKICETAMTGKGAEDAKDHLSELISGAIKQLSSLEKSNEIKQNIKIEKKTGGEIKDSELINGIILDKEKVHSAMPTFVKNAKIALIDFAIEVKSPETDTKININNPETIQEFIDMEENMLKAMVKKIVDSKANVVICQKGIDDLAQYMLAKEGIYACRRVTKSDMVRLVKATGGSIISDVNELSSINLGKAGLVEEQTVGEDSLTYIKECVNPKVVSILIRGATNHIIDEVGRAVEDAIGDVTSAISSNTLVAGAGSIEMKLSVKLNDLAKTLSGKEQLAVLAFAQALEIIPKTLAENAGLDPIDVLAQLKASQKANPWPGINVYTGEIINAWAEGIIEPLKIKTQAISSASEVATLILRIDDVILANKNGEPITPPSME